MRNQSWGNTARRQDSFRRGGFQPSFQVVEHRVHYYNAGFWLRAFAWWWDTLIFGLMQITVTLPLFLILAATAAVSLSSIRQTFGTPQGLRTLLESGDISLVLIGSGLVSVGLYCLYHVSFEVCFKGATPGKWLIGLRVFDGEDQPLTIGQSLARNVYKFTSFGIFMFGIILSSGLFQAGLVPVIPLVLVITAVSAFLTAIGGYLMAGLNEHKQALHDKWSYSYVVIDPACSKVKRIIFSGIAAGMILLSAVSQYYKVHASMQRPGWSQSMSILHQKH